MNAIYILWLRQVKRYMRSKARVVGALGQPLLFLLALGFGLGAVFHKAGAGNYIQYLSAGVVAMGILFLSIFTGMEIIWDRQFGFLKETLVAPVSRLTIVFGRALGGATVAFIQGVLVLVVCLIAGARVGRLSYLPVAAAFMILIALFSTALGTIIGSILEDMQGFPLVMNFLVMPLFFISNALFPTEGLPKILRILVGLNPLSYGIDGLRGALNHGFHYGMGIDFIVLGVPTALLFAIGSYFFSRIQV